MVRINYNLAGKLLLDGGKNVLNVRKGTLQTFQDRANGENFSCTREMQCSIASGEGQFCYVVRISARALIWTIIVRLRRNSVYIGFILMRPGDVFIVKNASVDIFKTKDNQIVFKCIRYLKFIRYSIYCSILTYFYPQ